MEIDEIKKNSANKEFMLKAVQEQGKFLDLASDELKDDEDVVKAALNQDGESLEYVSDRLKDNKEIVMLAISKAPWTACYASEKLKADKVQSDWSKTKPMLLSFASLRTASSRPTAPGP